MRRLTSFNAASVSVITGAWVSVLAISMADSLSQSLLRIGLLLVIGQRCFNRVFGQHGTVNLDRRQVQLLHDVRIFNLLSFIDRLALEPFSCEAGASNGRATAEGLELGVHDGVALDLDLQLHYVAAFRCADHARAD